MLTLQQIRQQIEKRARVLGAKPEDLPSYGTSRDSGYPHIEVDSQGYHWVVVERGRELERRSFDEVDDLLFTVFAAATHSIASRWELANRVPSRDFRRLLFQRQIELLSSLDTGWGRRQREHIDELLREYPYRDETPS